jgi:primosomal protein N' (replication factor Y)
MSSQRYAEVAVPLGFGSTLTYAVPEELQESVRVGSRVGVPLGSRTLTAFVTALSDSVSFDSSKVRDILEVFDDGQPAFSPEILELCRWAAEYYIAPLGEMLKVALPGSLAQRGAIRFVLLVTREEIDALQQSGTISKRDAALALAVADGDDRELRSNRDASRRLVAAGVVEMREEIRDRKGVRLDRIIILDSPPPVLSDKQQFVVDLLEAAGGELPYSEILERGGSGSAVSTLLRKSVLRVEQRPRRRGLGAFVTDFGGALKLKHTTEQRQAIERVSEAFGRFQPFLLQGVTGSGKTEVYLELIRRTVAAGQKALMLVPEISLTPAAAGRLTSTFGDRVAILHSNLSPSEKYDQWSRARAGEVDVAVGPRSALFTPLDRLGLIVVDEEGDAAYKQEETPRYNARDLAVVLGRIAGVPVVLGSATPSLESRENAERGKYTLLKLTERVEARPLPDVEVVDLRREKGEKEDRGLVIFSSPLLAELERTFAAGEQAMILMNRRGYAPFLLCRECEHDFRCRDCSVTLTVHRRAAALVCHYCGFRLPLPSRCPGCGGEVLQPIGYGTEKVHERFLRLFPSVSVEVLDRDAVRRKGELVKILDRFRGGKTQALIGTQMISKGHDFPNVTLTGVINSDSILGYPDFRSAEKTFYLLTQVAGRAGRGEIPGKVIVQSSFPQHYAIQHAARHDYDGFYASEIEFRRRFLYPPFSALIAILVRGEDERGVERVATEIARRIEERAAPLLKQMRMQGPAPAPLARLKGVHRYQILARSTQRSELRRIVADAVDGVKAKSVEIVVDVDPLNIL